MNKQQREQRKAKAKELYENTKDIILVQHQLGHKRIETTFRYIFYK